MLIRNTFDISSYSNMKVKVYIQTCDIFALSSAYNDKCCNRVDDKMLLTQYLKQV